MLNVRMGILRYFAPALACVLLCLLPLLAAGVQPAEAQTVCTESVTTELALDDGIAMDRATSGIGGCPSCTEFQGVKFTLPEGLSSSTLRATRIYAGSGKGKLKVYVTDAKRAYLNTPKEFTVNGTKWYEVVLGDIVVGNEFYIFIEREEQSSYFTKVVEPYYDSRRTGTSVYGESVEAFWTPPGDFMIRAVIVPQVKVGPGQDYETIQGAVDAVWAGWTITLGDGTYYENLTIDKDLIIKSVNGPTKTIVQAAQADQDVFRITAGCVKISGLTIRGATDAGRAGVFLDSAGGCVISGNVMEDNYYGIYVSEGSEYNILLENECRYNVHGIFVEGSENYLSGNRLHGNTAIEGGAVYLSSTASGNQLRFNSITLDPGMDPAVAEGPHVYNQNTGKELSAIENWWGTATGPSNGGGQGPAVGEAVDYQPWLAKPPVRVKTVAAQSGPFTLDAKSETSTSVLKEGLGNPFVSVASFGENPAGEFKHKTLGKWVDVLLSKSEGIDVVEIRVHYTANELAAQDLKEGSLRLYWWNGQKWKACSKGGVDKENDFVWAKLTAKSKPTPADLTGTMFAVGKSSGSFSWWLIPLIIFIVLLLLVVFRLIWVLVVKRERYTLD